MKFMPPLQRSLFCVILGLGILGGQLTAATESPVIWRFESARVANAPAPTVLGAPRAVVEDGHKAQRFDGVDDGLIIPENVIKGQRAFTVEVLFKPDGDGPLEQRFVHIEDAAQNRALIETRVTPGKQWYLDTFLYSKPTDTGLTLVERNMLHPCDRWYWAALVYDGEVMAHFVNARKEKEGTIAYGPMIEGRTSVGVRLNQVFWFKGAIAEVRFHPRPLAASELQRVK
jgi:hypothetical protein